MSLIEKAASAISFNIGQTIVSKALAAINLAILIRLLPTQDIGAIGLSAGYLAVLGFLMIQPEVIFVRDFPKIKGRVTDYISSFLVFGMLRSLLIVCGAVGVGYWLIQSHNYVDLGIYFVLAAIATSISSLTGPFREAFYASFRQGRIMAVDLATNIMALVLVVAVVAYPSLLTYGIIQIVTAIIAALGWYWTARKHLGYKFHLSKDWKRIAYDSFSDFALWINFSATLNKLLYQADIIILGFFVGLSALGDYTIALTIANVFFIIPQLSQKVFSVMFSQLKEEKLSEALGGAFKYNTIISIAQFLGFLVVSDLLIAFFGPQNPENVKLYAFFILLGVSLFNISRPWTALVTIKAPAKKIFIEMHSVSGLIAIFIYWWAASNYGILGVAQANLLVYAFAALWIMLYVQTQLHIVPKIQLISIAEKNYFHKILHTLKAKR